MWFIDHGVWENEKWGDESLSLSLSLQSVVSPLLMYLQYHVAYVRLGGQVGGRRRRERETWLGGDWGGTEGIGEKMLTRKCFPQKQFSLCVFIIGGPQEMWCRDSRMRLLSCQTLLTLTR